MPPLTSPNPFQAPEPFDAYSCFETCRVKAGVVLHLSDHFKRLQTSIKTLDLTPLEEGSTLRDLRQAAREVGNGFVRILVRREGEPRFILHRHPGIPYSERQRMQGIALTTVPTRQPSVEAVPAQVKHSQRLSGILARLEGRNSPEVLRLGSHGYLTEGTVSNLFLVKDKTLITAPPWIGVLEGVTRHRVMEAARRGKIPVQEIPVTRHELFNAQEAFLTNVLMGIAPIAQVDGRQIGTQVPGPITRRLMRALG